MKTCITYLKANIRRRLSCGCLFFLLILLPVSLAAQDFPKVEIKLPRQSSTIYQILNQVSRQTGYFFIYDSQVVESDKVVRIANTQEDLLVFLKGLLGDDALQFKRIDRHILIYRPEQPLAEAPKEQSIQEVAAPALVLHGRVLDAQTGNPLPWASIRIANSKVGVSTNMDGVFRIRLPEQYANDTLVFSYLGYSFRMLPVDLLRQGFVDVALEMMYVSLQEIVISYFDPKEVLHKALAARADNYNTRAVNFLSFYREGVSSDEHLLSYSEAVVREYVPDFMGGEAVQNVVLKSRKVVNNNRRDTLIFKLKAGLQSAIDLDVVRNLPDFLDPEYFDDYQYTASGLMYSGSSTAYVIDFEQKSHVREALHKGSIYVDQKSFAIVSIEFQLNPLYVNQVLRRFVPRPNPDYVIQILEVKYHVRYQFRQERYYLNHIRGEIQIRVRRKNRLRSTDYKLFLEKAVMNVETEQVTRYRRRETTRTNTIFADQNFVYDPDFWGEYNIVGPEKEIGEALKRIIGKVESTEFE